MLGGGDVKIERLVCTRNTLTLWMNIMSRAKQVNPSLSVSVYIACMWRGVVITDWSHQLQYTLRETLFLLLCEDNNIYNNTFWWIMSITPVNFVLVVQHKNFTTIILINCQVVLSLYWNSDLPAIYLRNKWVKNKNPYHNNLYGNIWSCLSSALNIILRLGQVQQTPKWPNGFASDIMAMSCAVHTRLS